MSAISLEHVSKHWTTADGAVRAVDDISFSLDAGTFNVLLGPSGCGKSTTLRLIAGLERADGGTVRIAGRDVTDLPPAQRGIAMVFQSYALFPHLTVAENIVFGLKVKKVDSAERAQRLARVAELLGLAKLLARKPSQLSGGQQQRVALGRAIIAEAPVCLMDEPLSNLDAQLRQDMRVELKALQRKLGVTMVYVTHDQVEAMTMADRVILLDAGRIVQNGAPVELYETPASLFAARFIGTPPMSLVGLEPRAQGAATEGAVIAGTEGPVISDAKGAIVMGLRPEHVAISRENGVEGVVETVEYLGADSLVKVAVGREHVVARVAGRVAFAPGDAVRVAWARGAQHFFDPVTGARRELDLERAPLTMVA